MKKELKIYRLNDKSDSYDIKKGLLPDVSFRMLVIGRSKLSGKSNLVGNLLLLPEFYKNDFDEKNIFIISPSLDTDPKLQTVIEQRDIPKQNTFSFFDEELLKEMYNMIEEEYVEAVENKQKPNHYLWIFDDMSYSGIFKAKNFGIVKKMFSNGRHINLSVIITAQKASDIPTAAFENASAAFCFACSDRQLDKIEQDMNYNTSRKEFKKQFRATTKEPHSFMLINFSNPAAERYLDKDFKPIVFADQ
jgi:hypothetical protein